ncbi:MAG: GNAT family N-acetyltransferase [Ruminococcaceae bacterium]|nr:GNAT family N-acetyltransferase [Oscillospiraceae bacterium]
MVRNKVRRSTLKYYAKMASEAYINDPVYCFACKNEKIRKRFIYHFLLLRLNSSKKKDIIYFDKEDRGLCIFREAHYDYTMFQFLKCPNWVFLVLYFPLTIKTLMAYSHLDNKDVFDDKTYIVSPVFVSPDHQGKGIATSLLKKGMDELLSQGYKIGLETQNPDNVGFYEKLGFKTVKSEYYKLEKIHNYYMLCEGK